MAPTTSWVVPEVAAATTATTLTAAPRATGPIVLVVLTVLSVLALGLPVILTTRGHDLLRLELVRLLRGASKLLLLLLLLLSLLLLSWAHRAWDGLRVLVNVEALVNASRDRLDFDTQILLNVVEVEAVIPADKVDGEAQVAVAARTANAVQVGLGVLGEVEVDNNIHGLNVNTTGKKVGAHKVAASAVAEVVENAITSVLGHLGVAVEAGIAQFGDLLGEQLYTVRRVAEDDRLVDLQLVEERVEAVDLLLLFDKCIVLRNTAQSELIHQVDLEWIGHMLVGELFDRHGEGSREEHKLPVVRVVAENFLDGRGELLRKQFVGLVHNNHATFAEIGNFLACQVSYSARCADQHMHGVAEADDVVAQACATGGNHHVDIEMFAEGFADLRCLHGELAGGHKNDTLDLVLFGVDTLKTGDDKSGGLASAVLRAGQNVPALNGDRDAFFLDWRGPLETGFKDAHHELALEGELLKFQALGVCDILKTENCAISTVSKVTRQTRYYVG